MSTWTLALMLIPLTGMHGCKGQKKPNETTVATAAVEPFWFPEELEQHLLDDLMNPHMYGGCSMIEGSSGRIIYLYDK